MSLPFDNVKTKLQKQTKLADGTMPYSGFVDCALKTAKNEGIPRFWAGLPTFVVRITPHVMIVNNFGFICLDTCGFRVFEEDFQMKKVREMYFYCTE